MQSLQRIRGLVAAPFTPMDSKGSVKLDAIRPYAQFLGRNGISAAFVCGTSGESMSLSAAERMAIAERWIRDTPKPLKVIVHVGHNSLVESQALAAHARKAGAWAIAANAPSFFKPSSVETLVDFCAGISEAAPGLPFYYYHIPALTGVNFPMVDFLRMAGKRMPDLAGIKYTANDLMDFGECVAFEGGRYDIVSGYDEHMIGYLAFGARGAIGSTYSYAAPIFLDIMKAFENRNLARARVLQRKANAMISTLLRTGHIVPVSKAIMEMLGFEFGSPRLPLKPMTAAAKKVLRKDLDRIGFFGFCSKMPLGTPSRRSGCSHPVRE